MDAQRGNEADRTANASQGERMDIWSTLQDVSTTINGTRTLVGLVDELADEMLDHAKVESGEQRDRLIILFATIRERLETSEQQLDEIVDELRHAEVVPIRDGGPKVIAAKVVRRSRKAVR